MNFQEILHTMAQVAATLAGFASVVAILDRENVERYPIERQYLLRMLLTSFAVMFVSIILSIVLESNDSQDLVWRWANGILGIFHFWGLTTEASFRSEKTPLNKRHAFFVAVPAATLIVLNFVVAFGYLLEYAPMVLLFGMCWLMGIACLFFTILVLSLRSSK